MAVQQPRSMRPLNLDWTRDPVPTNLTPFQEFFRTVDWTQTSVGPMHTWPRELRQAVLMMVAEDTPVIIYWGEHYTMLYNEAYIPLVGKLHPFQMGANAQDIFPSFWPYFDGVISEQRLTGQTRTGEASMLLMERQGFVEETYFNWKLVPIIGDNGTVVAAYGRPTESSKETIFQRRISCLEKLSERASSTTSLAECWEAADEGLRSCENDITFALIYSVEQHTNISGSPARPGSVCHLEKAIGISKDSDLIMQNVNIQTELDRFGPEMLSAYNTGELVVLDTNHERVRHTLADIEWQGFGVPSKQLVILAIKANGMPQALFILGLNPYLQFDSSYRQFLHRLAEVLSAQVGKIRLADEVKRRTEAAKLAALETQKSEIKFSRFAERNPVGLILTSPTGKILYANEAWHKFTGIEAVVYGHDDWRIGVCQDDLKLADNWWHKATIFRQSETFTVRSRASFERGHMRSKHRTAMVAIYPDADDEGNILSVMGLFVEISEQKWTEDQLRLRQKELEISESQYRNFAERSPHGVVRTDEQGYAQFANNAWLDFYSFTQEQLTDPEPWLKSIEEKDRPACREFFRSIRDNRRQLTVEFRLQRQQRTIPGKEANINEIWLVATGWAEARPDGSIDHIIFWVTDITAQKAAAKVLEDKMEEAIRLKTQQERFMDMISHEIRNPLSAVLHCGEEIIDSMKRCMTAMDMFPCPSTLSHEQGALQTLAREQVNNALDAAHTIMYCVQHQKQIVDDVLTLSKLDSDLLVVSPVAVQPMELVQSALKIFEPELKSADIHFNLEHDSSIHQLNAEWILLDPNRFLQVVINLVTNAIKFTRKSHIRRILMKVTAQDRKPTSTEMGVTFVPSGPNAKPTASTIEPAPDVDSNEPVYLCFNIADTGKGLTEAERRILFYRFSQGSPKTHTEYGGSGLGLFISKHITEMLGGEIGVGDGPHGGCTFGFYVKVYRTQIPRRASYGQEVQSTYTKALVNPTASTWTATPIPEAEKIKLGAMHTQLSTPEPINIKRRVLVVEDNLINQKVLCKQLRGRGFMVEAANHGREALTILEKDNQRNIDELKQKPRFDVILCDIEMPVMDGIECVTEIRRQEREGKLPGHIPIIGVTANVRSKQVNTAIDVGMDGVTTKPYRIDELIAHIDRVCIDAATST